MNHHALYERSPYPLRVLAASTRGAVLRRRRYSRSTDALVEQALERESWSPRAWNDYQSSRLRALLLRARRDVPAYREQPYGSLEPDAGLAEYPILEKSALRADPRRHVRDGSTRGLIREHTSGTTGTPLTTFIEADDYRFWYALAEARWRRWYGVSRTDRWAIVGGQQVVSTDARAAPYWVWNAALRQLYLSSYHIAESTVSDYADALARHRVRYVLGYPSSLHALAMLSLRTGTRLPRMRVVIANAEPVLDHQREVIAEVFGCPVRETYGMAEYVTAASECEYGRLHLWPDAGILEVLSHHSNRPVAPGTPGRFVATGLINTAMPLIRYAVGDSGTIAPTGEKCQCGRTLPLLGSVHGRSDDLVRTRDGRLIGRLDPVFKGGLPIESAQIIQESLDRFLVKVVPAGGFTDEHAAAVEARLRERVGEIDVRVERVEQLPVGPNGKFRAVVSHVDPMAR